MTLKKLKFGTSSKEIIEALEKDGAVIILDALQKDKASQLNETTQKMLEQVDTCEGLFHGFNTKRIGGMVGKLEVCHEMALNENVLDVMDHFLLPRCYNYQIQISQLIAIQPGEGKQMLHPDDPLFPVELKDGQQKMINVMWAVNDFTKENGATQVIPGSHKWSRDREPKPEEVEYAEMPQGSCLIYLGSTIHGGGENISEAARYGLVMSYNLGWLRQAENQYLSVTKEQAQRMPEKLQRLIGYDIHRPNMGMANGTDPIEYLQDSNKNKRIKFKDFMPEEAEEILENHNQDKDSHSWADCNKQRQKAA